MMIKMKKVMEKKKKEKMMMVEMETETGGNKGGENGERELGESWVWGEVVEVGDG